MKLRVKATNQGSFAVTLLAEVPTLAERLVDLVTSKGAEAALNAAGLYAIVTGAWKVLKRLGGRSITDERAVGEQVTWTLSDGEEITIDAVTARVLNDLQFRQATEQFTAPLEAPGISEVSVTSSSEGSNSVVITADETRAFQTPPSTTIDAPSEIVNEFMLQPLGVEFDWRQWRVTDGGSKFSVTMADEDFRHRVDEDGLRIGANDLFKVRMRIVQEPKADGTLRIKRTVEKVLQQYPGGTQGRMDLP